MANNGKTAKVERQVEKIENWNGEDINDIVDSLDIIRANGGKFDMVENAKALPDAFEDMSDVEGIFAIDAEGNILYVDEQVGTVQVIRDRRHREEIGLAPMDDLLDFIKEKQIQYETDLAIENGRLSRRGNKTSANYRAYTEALTVLDAMKGKIGDAATAMEAAMTN